MNREPSKPIDKRKTNSFLSRSSQRRGRSNEPPKTTTHRSPLTRNANETNPSTHLISRPRRCKRNDKSDFTVPRYMSISWLVVKKNVHRIRSSEIVDILSLTTKRFLSPTFHGKAIGSENENEKTADFETYLLRTLLHRAFPCSWWSFAVAGYVPGPMAACTAVCARSHVHRVLHA